ncbi:MAG TPA: 50S ribosomal protein L4 [Bacilli bacterium]|jgi:large subunit ribosomal protein L4|nr:50S ribosomal protein L4 [Bacilli bacterium]
MTKLKELNLKGENVKEVTLDDNVWKTESNDVVLKKAIKLQLDSLRQGTHDTKGRSEVSGGGKKPYRQKGTGRARQGTIRAPQYRGGGIVFGPTPRSYSFKINRKERGLALRSALSLKLADKKVVVVDSLEIASTKTKDVQALLDTLKVSGKVLFVSSNDAEKLFLATRNIGNVAVEMADEVNVYDITNATYIVLDEGSVKYIEEALN